MSWRSSITQPRLLPCLTSVLAIWLIAGCADGGSVSQEEEQQDGEADTFTVVAPGDVEERVELGEVDLGAEGPSVGDLYVVSGPIYDESEESELGHIDGQCTMTRSTDPSAEARRLCIVAATFVEEHEGAQIVAQGVGSIEAEEAMFAVTGGTGYYGNARGQATFESRDDGAVLITYELDTKH